MNLPDFNANEILVQPLHEISDGEIVGSVGVVKARGIQIKDVSLTDYVIFGSCQSNKISPVVHQLNYAGLPLKLERKTAGLIFHGAVILNSFYESQIQFGENILGVGKGYREQLARQISQIFGSHFFSSAEPPSTAPKIIDVLFVLSGNYKNQELKHALEWLRPRGRIVSLACWPVEKFWDILMQKQLQVLFPFSAGAALQANTEIGQATLPEEFVPRTVKKNLTEFRDWLVSGKITFENLENDELKTRFFDSSERRK